MGRRKYYIKIRYYLLKIDNTLPRRKPYLECLKKMEIHLLLWLKKSNIGQLYVQLKEI